MFFIRTQRLFDVNSVECHEIFDWLTITHRYEEQSKWNLSCTDAGTSWNPTCTFGISPGHHTSQGWQPCHLQNRFCISGFHFRYVREKKTASGVVWVARPWKRKNSKEERRKVTERRRFYHGVRYTRYECIRRRRYGNTFLHPVLYLLSTVRVSIW